MRESEGSGACPWNGKRLTSFALGHVATMCESVRSASSVRYRAALLAAPRQVGAAVAALESSIKAQWCAFVTEKASYYQHIPHRIVGAFGQYCGHSLSECKSCIQQCFKEWAETPNDTQANSISLRFLSGESVVSQKLKAYAESSTSNLHSWRELVLEIQEYAFGACVERYTEGEHKRIKASVHRGLMVSKPAYACAHMRHPRADRILETPYGMDLFVTSWHSKSIYRDLLSHLATPAEVASMPISERLANIYQFHAKAHFKDRSEESAGVHQASVIRAL